jgi:MarR family transcriptional regulator, organic hydroperoxide resistance regulator
MDHSSDCTADAGSSSTADQIEAALVEFYEAFRRSRSRLSRDPGLGRLNLAEFALLRAAAEHGSQGIGSVAEAAGMAQPPASRGIDRLQAKGLISTEPHPADKRRTNVQVTTAGYRLLAHHRARLRDAAQRIATRLGPQNAHLGPALLRLLGEALEQATE